MAGRIHVSAYVPGRWNTIRSVRLVDGGRFGHDLALFHAFLGEQYRLHLAVVPIVVMPVQRCLITFAGIALPQGRFPRSVKLEGNCRSA